MRTDVNINELWSLRINPSDLYNIERTSDDNPPGGGGHTYIQIPRSQVQSLLEFLHDEYPPNGFAIRLPVFDRTNPEAPPEEIEFWAKSAGRMRISRQNRHRHSRLTAWSPERGFPTLEPFDTTENAKELLDAIGGLHIFLARGENNLVWAGYTTGIPNPENARLPFADILWGESPGGLWAYKESNS